MEGARAPGPGATQQRQTTLSTVAMVSGSLLPLHRKTPELPGPTHWALCTVEEKSGRRLATQGRGACIEIWAAGSWVSLIQCNLPEPDLCPASPVGSGVCCIPCLCALCSQGSGTGRLLTSLKLGHEVWPCFLGPHMLSTRNLSWDCAARRQSCLS